MRSPFSSTVRLNVFRLLIGVGLIALALIGTSIQAAPPATPPAAPPEQARARCTRPEDFRHVASLGPACRLPNGHWRVRMKDGTTEETHGPDGLAAEPPPGDALLAPTSLHACVADLTNGYYGLVIYVYGSDMPDNYATVSTTIRNNFQAAQDKLNAEALEFGVSASYKMACATDSSVRIDKVQLATPHASTTFSTVVSDLRAQGYNNPRAKYWVWYDGRPPGAACGVGHLRDDDRGSLSNSSNGNTTSALFGVSFGCNAMMHENGHNLGAVQDSAPNTSGAGHCNDDRDVMCYNDGGPNSGGYRNNVCTDREHYDCNHDDYFHPNPAVGSYLASHWNIAACYNRYIQRSGCDTTPTPTGTTPPQTPTSTPIPPTPTGTAIPPTPTRTPGPSVTVFTDDFETHTGWTVNPSGTDTATTGLWERGDPAATSSSGTKQQGTTPSGSNDLVTGRLAGSGAGDFDIDGGVTSIRSPSITLPATGNLSLSFAYYLAHGTNSSSADYLRVRIVGSTTTTVFEELGAANDDDAAWATTTVSLNSFAGQTITILIEAADAGSASLVEAAVDDVRVVQQ